MSSRKLSDDLFRTGIYLVGTGVALYILFAFHGFLAVLFSMGFMMVSGNAMRRAWFPIGKVIDSAFWFALATGAFLASLFLRVFAPQDRLMSTVVLGAFSIFTAYETYRSVRFAKSKIETARHMKDEQDTRQ